MRKNCQKLLILIRHKWGVSYTVSGSSSGEFHFGLHALCSHRLISVLLYFCRRQLWPPYQLVPATKDDDIGLEQIAAKHAGMRAHVPTTRGEYWIRQKGESEQSWGFTGQWGDRGVTIFGLKKKVCGHYFAESLWFCTQKMPEREPKNPQAMFRNPKLVVKRYSYYYKDVKSG